MLLLLPAARTPLACVSTCPCLRLQFFIKDLTGMVGGILFASSQVSCVLQQCRVRACLPLLRCRHALLASGQLLELGCRLTARSVPATQFVQGQGFDCYAKQWRLAADVMNDVGERCVLGSRASTPKLLCSLLPRSSYPLPSLTAALPPARSHTLPCCAHTLPCSHHPTALPHFPFPTQA